MCCSASGTPCKPFIPWIGRGKLLKKNPSWNDYTPKPTQILLEIVSFAIYSLAYFGDKKESKINIWIFFSSNKARCFCNEINKIITFHLFSQNLKNERRGTDYIYKIIIYNSCYPNKIKSSFWKISLG